MTPTYSPEADDLCERNVVAQVEALSVNPLVRGAWERRAELTLHGWVYAIGDGLLQEVCEPVRNAMACGDAVTRKASMP
jgi:carbonic anhydrase